MVRKALTAVLVVATAAWALHMILAADDVHRHKTGGDGQVGVRGLEVSADVRTLPMSEVRRGITEAIQDRFLAAGCSRPASAATPTAGAATCGSTRCITTRRGAAAGGRISLIGESDYMRARHTQAVPVA
jgi:hypothetical protein